MMKRRNILLGLGLLPASAPVATGLFSAALTGTLTASGTALAEGPEIGPDDRILGDPEAPITIVEYASMTCPHCAAFHADIMPSLKETWIDSGRARMVFRHFPLDAIALRASGLAECIEGPRFFGFVDLLFATQAQWSRSGDPLSALIGLGRQAGISEQQAQTCLNDEATLTNILLQRKEAAEVFKVNSTPSFIVNGEKATGVVSFEKFDSFLQDLEDDLS